MKIGILGTRGIPNHYGGYEQITEPLAVGLVAKGHEVTVYNSHNHPNQAKKWKGISIHHCFDPEYLISTAGQFIYDLNCIRHARKINYDVILFMGYTSSSVWHWLFPKSSMVISNMDGMEWKRTKYSVPTRLFLKYAEKLAVKHSHFHIADSPAIKQYLDAAYNINSCFIPYGTVPTEQNAQGLSRFNLTENGYFMLIARMEPENNVEMILDGFQSSRTLKKIIVIGRTGNVFGNRLIKKYANDDRIIFLGSVFDQGLLHSLRKNTALYFHGHSVGGTNPSLLDAMASGSLIAAHSNPFNMAVLENNAFYFSTSSQVKNVIEEQLPAPQKTKWTENNQLKILTEYSWEKIIAHYDEFICKGHKAMML